MKVLVLNNAVPFLRGGAEHLADSLVEQLRRRGHEAELVRVPFRWESPAAVEDSMVVAAGLDLAGADLVVPLKFPAYLAPHPRRAVWLLHQFRQVYDLWGTPLQDVPDGPDGLRLREAVRRADQRALSSAHRLFTNSSVTADRLRRFNGLSASVLLPPHGDVSGFRSDGFEPYVLASGRLTASKRQHLVVEAMAHVPPGVRLVVAGAPETPGDLRRVEDLIERHGLADRVDLHPRFVSEQEKRDLLANAAAVAYLPVDEDSYGYVTAEAMLSSKPVVTTTDAGGVLQLVQDGRTGLVTQPDARALAAAMSTLALDLDLARTLGATARLAVEELDLSWDRAIEELVS